MDTIGIEKISQIMKELGWRGVMAFIPPNGNVYSIRFNLSKIEAIGLGDFVMSSNRMPPEFTPAEKTIEAGKEEALEIN